MMHPVKSDEVSNLGIILLCPDYLCNFSFIYEYFIYLCKTFGHG